jgi:DTW domain-containing protein YfiP
MGQACCHHDDLGNHPRDPEHPVVAIVAIIAIVAAMLLIAWARLEVHGTEDIEAALAEPAAQGELLPPRKSDNEREVDAAVTTSRFATGFSP